MAIDRKEFNQKIDIGLKANSKFNKFFYRCKVEGKQFYKTMDFSDKHWDKRTRISEAKEKARIFKKEKLNLQLDEIDFNIKLNEFKSIYFNTFEKSSSYSKDHWEKLIKRFYETHIKNEIGNKKILDIRQLHIKNIIQEVKKKGLSARTQKLVLEVLNPIFKSAISNRIIYHNPCDGITVKRPNTRKKVQNASQLLKEIYRAIITVFEKDDYFQALYLFALQGRRKSEILTLRWENIDFDKSTYTIPNTKNGEEQTFILPNNIENLLQLFKSNNEGYVFVSPTEPSKHIQNIQAQTNKLKSILNNPNFGIHYLRNVVVSAMAEQGINTMHLSGALGHSDTHTISRYLSIPYEKGSRVANEIIEGLTNE